MPTTLNRRAGMTTSGRIDTSTPNPVTQPSIPVVKFDVPFQYRKTAAALHNALTGRPAITAQVTNGVVTSVTVTSSRPAPAPTNSRSCVTCGGPVYMKNKHYNKLCTTCNQARLKTTV